MFMDTQLNETQRDFVTKLDYYRTDDQVDEDVTKLLEWMSKQPHLPEITDRKWLSHFIIGSKYNLHRAKRTIDTYFVTRAEYPEFICPIDWEQVSIHQKYGSISVFPKLTPEAYQVLYIRINPLEKDTKVDYFILFKMLMASHDLQMKTYPVYGNIFLFDVKHLSLGQLVNISPTMTKNYIKLCNALPFSMKGVHFINPPPFISQIMTFAKMVLPGKLKQRVYAHDTLETLYEFIPKHVLPDKYGGTAGDIEKFEENLFEYGKANHEWFGSRPKADLSKRVGQPNVNEFGVEGTFKKLGID